MKKLDALQGLRGLAMIGVFLFHSGFLRQGTFPVTLFFMLSGFLMCYTKSEKCEKVSFPKWVGGYVFHKLKKFYPLHFITFAMACVVGGVIHKINLEVLFSALLNLLLINPFFKKYALIFNELSWFLSVILFLYIIAYPLQKVLNRIENCILPFAMTIIIIVSLNIANRLGAGLYLYTNPLYRNLDFWLGMLTAKMYLQRRFAIERANICEIILVVVFLFQYMISLFIFEDPGYYSILFSVALYVFAVGEGCVSKLLANNFFQIITYYSFEFYMVHELILRIFRKIFDESIFYPVRLVLIAVPSMIISALLAFLYRQIGLRRENHTTKERSIQR